MDARPGALPARAAPYDGCGDRLRGMARPAWLVIAISHMSNPAPARLCIACGVSRGCRRSQVQGTAVWSRAVRVTAASRARLLLLVLRVSRTVVRRRPAR